MDQQYKWHVIGYSGKTGKGQDFIIESVKEPTELINQILKEKGEDFIIENMDPISFQRSK